MNRPVLSALRTNPVATWIAIFTLLYCASVSLVVGYRARSVDRAEATLDFRDFWLTARHFRITGEIRDDLGVHNYPPIFTILMTPWSLLPLQPAAVLFTLCSIGLFGWAVLHLAHALKDHEYRGTRWALLAVFPYIHATVVLGQVNLLVVALLLAAAAALLKRRECAAGVSVAAAAAVKIVPIVLLGYFLLTRRLRAAAGCVVTLLVLFVATPTLVVGPQETRALYARFREHAVAGHSARETIIADKPQKAKYSNLAVPMVFRRILTPLNADPGAESDPLHVNLADWPRDRVWLAYIAFASVVGAATMAISLLSFFRPLSRHRNMRILPLFGAWCASMLLASPMVWTHHLVMILPALYALVYCAVPRRIRGSPVDPQPDSLVMRVALTTLLVWCATMLALIWPAARAAGVPMLGVLIVWAGCAWIAWREQILERRIAVLTTSDAASPGSA